MKNRRSFLEVSYLFVVLCFSLSASVFEVKASDFVLKQKKAVVTIYVNDKNGNEIVSGSGFIVDRNGIIAANCKLISRWLEDVEYTLMVKTEGETFYPINKLIAYSRRHDIALFEINAESLPVAGLPADFKAADYIKRHLLIYKRTVKTALPKPPAERPKGAAESRSKKTLLEIARLPESPVEIKKPDVAEDHFMRGLKYESERKYKDAIEAYKQAVKIKPHYVDAYLNLGQVHYKLGKYPEAVDVYKQALKMRPDMQTYNKLGTLYIVSGKYSEAIDIFEQAIGIDSRNPETHFNLGIAYFLSGDKDAAYEEYIILNRLDERRAEDLFDLLYR